MVSSLDGSHSRLYPPPLNNDNTLTDTHLPRAMNRYVQYYVMYGLVRILLGLLGEKIII